MKREDVFKVIERELEYQNQAWPRDERCREIYKSCAPHIILAEKYILKAKAQWTEVKDETQVFRTVGKLTTILVRALTEVEPVTGKGSAKKEEALRIITVYLDNTYRLHGQEPRSVDSKFIAPHILLLGKIINEAGDLWRLRGEEAALRILTDAAVAAVNALEVAEGPDLLETGLRGNQIVPM